MDFFVFKQKTAYELRICDGSSDVCSSDLEGHGLVFPPGLAGLVPRRADVVAGGLEAEVRGVLAVALVVGNQLDLDVERQGANRAGEAAFVCGYGAIVGHDADRKSVV